MCSMITEVKITALRAMGIPTAYDYIVNWANSNSSHFWYHIEDDKYRKEKYKIDNLQRPKDIQHLITGASYDIVPLQDSLPKNVIQYYNRTIAKVYRKSFALTKDMHSFSENSGEIPYNLRGSHISDVTSKYLNCVNISYSIINDNKYKDGIYCLACFDNKNWTIQCLGKLSWNQQIVKFNNIGKNIVYLPVLYKDGVSNAIGMPFLLNNEGNLKELSPSKEKQEITLNMKYPFRSTISLWLSFMKGGIFKVANKDDFSDSTRIYKIDKIPFYQNTIKINSVSKKYRYFIYDYSSAHCYINRFDIGDIIFYDSDGKIIKGSVIGNSGSYNHEPSKVFDLDPLTYFEDNQNDSKKFVAIKTKPTRLSKIKFIGRNDGNNIIPGDKYELYLWNGKWKLIGKAIANADGEIVFKNVQKNALLFLKNSKGGAENRIFTYQNGKQLFW